MIVEAAPAADDGGRDRRDARDAALDRLGDPDPDRDGPARPARARAGRPLRARAARRARPRRRQEARPDRRRRRPARRAAAAQHYNRRYTDAAGKRAAHRRLGVRPHRRRRLQPPRLRRGARRREGRTAAGFLRRAVAFYRRYGIQVERVLTDNGAAYRAIVHALACRRLGIRHLRTRPYRPQTNGKAERFIRTMLNGWAYGAIYRSSHERTTALDGWLWHYNHRRRHSALGHQPPVSRTNLLGSYI